jgi:hypothetical protein
MRGREDEQPFANFLAHIKKATAEGEFHHLGRILYGPRGWESSGWFLERKYPDKWGRKTPQVAVNLQVNTQVQQARLELQNAACPALMTEDDRVDLDRLYAAQKPKALVTVSGSSETKAPDANR